MPIESRRVELHVIEGFRDIYRQEMNCQIMHDSIHSRPGWSDEYLFIDGGTKLGYGSIAVGGPWREQPMVYEFFVLLHDKLTTSNSARGAVFRRSSDDDSAAILQQQLDPEAQWIVSVEGVIAAAGDILFHYNRPYGDIYMKVAEPFQRRGAARRSSSALPQTSAAQIMGL